MALCYCPECGRKISDQATVCIGCGAPLVPAEPLPKLFLLEKGNQYEFGPFTLEEISDLLSSRIVTWQTLYSTPGMNDWQPLENIREQIHIRQEQQFFAKHKIEFIAIGIICLLALVIFAGNIHIINGQDVGPKMVWRNSFGYSEMFINTDKIYNMPWVSAKTLYPISVQVLQREHLLDSDEERLRKIREKDALKH